jgi:chromosome partitioning protein
METTKKAIILSFGIQKGGCGKSTTAGILIHELAKKYKVLAVDMDMQGNLTELLTDAPSMECEDFSVKEAILDENAIPYIHHLSDSLDLIPANNTLAVLPRLLYKKFGFDNSNHITALDRTLEPLKSQYDFIILDTPPALSEHTLNALFASDYVVIMFESSKWCWSAIPNFMDSIETVQRLGNSNLKIAGILRTLIDSRRYDNKAFCDQVGDEYPDLVFETILKRKAATGRLPYYGFHNNIELNTALEQYLAFIEELLHRVGKK